MGETRIHPLLHPISETRQAQGSPAVVHEITEVQVRRFNGGDKRFVSSHQADPNVDLGLMSRMTGLTVAQIDQLDIEDILAITDIITGFLPPSLLAGKTS